MVPHNDDDEEIEKQHAFTRGIMTFDDYNYKNVNDYVLVTEPGTGNPEIKIDSIIDNANIKKK